MKDYLLILSFIFTTNLWAQGYAPQAGSPNSTAIHKDSNVFQAWATDIVVDRGYQDISNQSLGLANAGIPQNALGKPDGFIVSLGDKGSAVLTFDFYINDGPGYDFAIFENGMFGYLELATVEVSSDGIHFFGFPTHSLTQTNTQIPTMGSPLAENLNNLAGKYINDYGTPFDLSEIKNDPKLDKRKITHIKVIDVVGSINPLYGTFDSYGNLINDSFPTPFGSSGFDLQAVGVINGVDKEHIDVNPYTNKPTIYPNPASHYLFINTNKLIGDVFVFNTLGQRVLQVDKSVIDVSNLKAGVYIMQFETSFGKQTEKFIKK